MGIGFVHMLADLGVFVKQALKIRVDAAAGIAIASRLGAGRIRHIHAPALWLQQEVIDSRVGMDKVHGLENPADAGTKHLTGPELDRHTYGADGVLLARGTERAGAQGGAREPQLNGLVGYNEQLRTTLGHQHEYKKRPWRNCVSARTL